MLSRKVIVVLLAALSAWLLAPSDAGANLVAYWNFDTDFSATLGGAIYDATPNNGASISAVQSKWGGGAAHFEKALSQFGQTDASPFGTGSYSYSLWFYLDLEVTDSDRQFAGFGTGGAGDAYTAFFNIDGDGGADPGNDDDILVTRVATDGLGIPPNVVAFFPDRPTNHQAWKNLIVTVDYDSVANTTMLTQYYNGLSNGASAALSGKPLQSEYVVFGVDRGLAGRFWEGYIDDVAVYDHVLTAEEIVALQLGPAVGDTPLTTGDYNGNGAVDAADYTLWRNTYGTTVTAGDGADGDADGMIDDGDYSFWKSHFGDVVFGSASGATVPEPSVVTLAMITLGLVTFGMRNRVD